MAFFVSILCVYSPIDYNQLKRFMFIQKAFRIASCRCILKLISKKDHNINCCKSSNFEFRDRRD